MNTFIDGINLRRIGREIHNLGQQLKNSKYDEDRETFRDKLDELWLDLEYFYTHCTVINDTNEQSAQKND